MSRKYVSWLGYADYSETSTLLTVRAATLAIQLRHSIMYEFIPLMRKLFSGIGIQSQFHWASLRVFEVFYQGGNSLLLNRLTHGKLVFCYFQTKRHVEEQSSFQAINYVSISISFVSIGLHAVIYLCMRKTRRKFLSNNRDGVSKAERTMLIQIALIAAVETVTFFSDSNLPQLFIVNNL